jgi:hypothetical protein
MFFGDGFGLATDLPRKHTGRGPFISESALGKIWSTRESTTGAVRPDFRSKRPSRMRVQPVTVYVLTTGLNIPAHW